MCFDVFILYCAYISVVLSYLYMSFILIDVVWLYRLFFTIEADTTHPVDMLDRTPFRVHAQLLFVNLICHCLIDLRGLNIRNFRHSSEYVLVNKSENKLK